jgi:hypothetical protein
MNPYLDASEVFISPESCHFQIREGLESPLLSVALIKDKYSLHILMRQ